MGTSLTICCRPSTNTRQAAADVHAARFQWHIGTLFLLSTRQMLTLKGSIASFQAIMHVLSELRNPLFDAPDRQRALSALQMARILRENNGAKAWQAVKNMIDKAVAEHNASPRSQSQSSSTLASPTAPVSSSIRMDNPSNGNIPVYPVLGTIPSYALSTSSGQYVPHNLPAQQQNMQPQAELLQPMQSMQDQGAPCWDDINLSNINNIVGDVEQNVGIIPDFDFVSNLLPRQ